MARNVDDYWEVVEPWILPNGSSTRIGELFHKDHPDLNRACARPVQIKHDVEAMTAEPGEKRATQVKRSTAKRAASG
jgi:hypothetical protein